MAFVILLLAQPDVVSITFEDHAMGVVVADWDVPRASAGYVSEATTLAPAEGDGCLELRATTADAAAWGTVQHHLDATPWRGQRIALSAAIRTQGDHAAGHAQMFMRVVRAAEKSGFVDNMHDRPVTSDTWVRHTIVGMVDRDAEHVVIGLLLKGRGRAWIDDIQITPAGPLGRGDEAPRAIDDLAVARVIAFIRLLGYVQHFHPSDQSMRVDWARVAVDGIDAAEGAHGPEELARALHRVLVPHAPTLQVWSGSVADAPSPVVKRGDCSRFTGLRHRGLGADRFRAPAGGGVYYSERVTEAVDVSSDPRCALPDTAVVASLGAGIACRVPITLYVDDRGTVPADSVPVRLNVDRAPGWSPTPADRSTRLATVGLAWNVIQHFYPYFDVVSCDWPAALDRGLREAAVAETSWDFLQVLRRLIAHIHDGHGRVWHESDQTFFAPMSFDWVDDQLVVLRSTPELGVSPGSVVLAIDGQAVDVISEALGRQVSSSTPGWRRYRVARQIAGGFDAGPVRLTLRDPDGSGGFIRAPRVQGAAAPQWGVPRPAQGAELAPGIRYFNLDAADVGTWQRVLPVLAAAQGVVFDLRGYPGGAGTEFLRHLTDETLHSTWWEVPIYRYPDQQDVEFERSRWTLTPLKPRLTSNAVVLTDGRAISYAESVLGIVEHYGLAEVVGAPTAGTNGNINERTLPGNYRMVWTGMRVHKHDGSRLNGVGILPTVPVCPTIAGIAAGRDEVLQKGLEVIKSKLTNAP